MSIYSVVVVVVVVSAATPLFIIIFKQLPSTTTNLVDNNRDYYYNSKEGSIFEMHFNIVQSVCIKYTEDMIYALLICASCVVRSA